MLFIEEPKLPEFAELMEQAKEKISRLYPAWTNYNPADSGMTILELFAYMTELQRFHALQTGNAHMLAFLHLLGISLRGMEPARMFAIQKDNETPCYLLAGTQLSVGALIWEVEKTSYLDPAAVPEKTGQKAPFYPFGETPGIFSAYEICFRQSLKAGRVYSLFFDLADPYPVKRNPICGEEFCSPVRLRLEYYDGTADRECRIVEDTTFGLLQTGVVTFYLTERQEEKDGKYRLLLCAEGEYDTAPLLKAFSFHAVPLVQQDTRVETKEYRLSSIGENFYEAVADSRNGVYGETRIYAKRGTGYHRLRFYSSYVHEGLRHFVLEGEILQEEGENAADDGTNGGSRGNPVVYAVSVREGQSFSRYALEADGSPGQRFFLPDRNVLGSAFSLWTEEETDYFVPWHRVGDLAAAGEEERCYVLDEKKGILRFGDGRFGKAPKGKIEITGYALCEGEKGNIRKDQRLVFLEERGTEPLYNPYAGKGGTEPEKIEEGIARYRKADSAPKRAVSCEDYERLIAKTPGLRIKKVKVFPAANRDNCMEAVVQPFTNKNRLLQTDGYKRQIMRFMEKRKLLCTELIIRKPQFVGVTLWLELAVSSPLAKAESRVKKAVYEYFDTRSDFGKPVSYSRLYASINMLPEVVRIHELSLHAMGKGVSKSENGDLALPIYGIAWLEEVKIRCTAEGKKK